jgi:hypothetical protein
MKKLYFILLIVPFIAKSQNLLVDNFSYPTNTRVLVAQINTGAPTFSFTSSNHSTTSLGGELDIFTVLTSSSLNPVQMDVFENGFGTKTLEMNQGTGEVGTLGLTWDGVDGSTNINYTGLGGRSVSNCGTLGFNYYTDFGSSNQMTVKLTIFTDATHASEITRVFNGTGGTTGINFATANLPLSGLTTVAGSAGPANLTNIGAIHLDFSFNTNGVDFLIDDVEFACPISLPVTLSAFNVNSNTDKNILTWNIESVNNLNKFIIEKSYNGSTFTAIGETSYTSLKSNYTYADKKSTQTVYYRLKMLDFDGTFKNSQIVKVAPNTKNQDVSVTTTVIKDKIQLLIKATEKKEYLINIVDVTGKSLLTKRVNATQGINVVDINDVKDIATGLVMLTVQSTDAERQTFKLFKQ